jgi:copper transport protein
MNNQRNPRPARTFQSRLLRWTLFAGVTLMIVLMTATPVSAHALPVASDPLPGAILQQPPRVITMTFNEAPEPTLSYINVLDTAGRHHEVGHAAANATDPRILSVGVANVGKGVYTVSWRTVASDDGHRITGSFAFGVQVSPPPHVSTQEDPATSALTAVGVASRAVYYVAIVFLLGGIAVAISVGPQFWGRLRSALAGAWVLAILGVLGITDSQLRSAGAGWDQLFHTSLWGSFATRLVPALAGAGALLIATRVSSRMQRWTMVAAGLGAALSTLADAAASHASTEANPVVSVALQWVHILAAGAWIGGLTALLLVISAVPAQLRSRLLERFAIVAVGCLLVVATTGVLRSVASIGSWQGLVTTLYGALVLAKVALILILAFLGVLNRVNAMRATAPLNGFRRVGSTQVVVALVALVLSSALVNVAPPSATAIAFSGPAPLVTTGTDGNTVKVHLEVSPGNVGFNHFTLTLTDYATGSPITDATVTLGFLFNGPETIGTSSLRLPSLGDGTFSADGANLSLGGSWSITAQVETTRWSYDVPLQLTTHKPSTTP